MSAVPADLPTTSAWRSALPAALALIALVLLLFRETATGMVSIWWRSETFAHAFLVLPLSLWLIWRQRHRLATIEPRPVPWILAPLLAAAVAWFLAELVVVNAATQFAFVALLVLLVPAVLGMEVTRAILFPLLFLFFMVPFGEFMLPPMMEWTASFVVMALQATGIPVYREGLYFVIPSGQWSVITECSGVRYLIASFMVGSLFAYLNYRSYRRRAIFMLVSLLVPVLANWLRAYLIVMMGHLSGNKLATGVDHILYGWVFFGIVIFVMFTIGMRWAEPDEPEVAGGKARLAGGGPVRALPGVGLGVALIAALPHVGLWTLQSADRAAADPRVEMPDAPGNGWAAGKEPVPDWAPNFGNPSEKVRKAFRSDAGTVGVFIGYYRNQGPDRKLVSSENGVVAINERIWNRVGGGTRELTIAGRPVTLRTTEILGPTRPGMTRRPHLFVWHAYWIDGRFIVSDPMAKIAGAASRLRGHGDDGAIVMLYANEDSPEASNRALAAFASTQLTTLDERLRATRAAR